MTKPMIVKLITKNNIPITIGVGSFAFPIQEGQVMPNDESLAGCKAKDSCLIPGDTSQGNEARYNEAYDLAQWAHKNSYYDEVMDCRRLS